LNPFSGVKGFKGLKLAKLLEDPTLKALFNEALKSIPPSSDPRKMLEHYPFDRCIGDSLAVGTIGFAAKSSGPGGRLLHYPEEGALPGDLFQGNVNFTVRNLLAIRVEDEALFMTTLARVLGDTMFGGEPPTPGVETVRNQKINVWNLGGIGKLYTKVVEGYFLVAQNSTDLIAAIDRQAKRKSSLLSRTDFGRFAKHCGEDPTAMCVHLGLDSAIDLFAPLIPRGQRQEIEQWGGFDFSGLQFAMGFHGGGIRECLHLAFAENPKGLLMNLARLWPSTGFVEQKTRRGTVWATSLTFDWSALYSATVSICDLLDVDTSSFARDVKSSLGLDLREDLMGAFGNTMGAVAVMPNLGFIPEVSLVFKVRNRAKMEKVLAKIKQICRHSGIPMKDFSVSGNGPKATYLNLGKDIPIRPAFVLTGDKLVVSMMPLMLKYAIRKTRGTGLATIDYVPDATDAKYAAKFDYFFDPAPLTENVYADLLKILDANRGALPIDPTSLPSPEFVAASLSKFGICVSMDAYYMALDLHSPTGFAIPLAVGTTLGAAQQTAPPKPLPKKAIH
jgi:hypothetical protein